MNVSYVYIAQKDLESSESLYSQKMYNSCVFYWQQAAEKYAKHSLLRIDNTHRLLRSHNIHDILTALWELLELDYNDILLYKARKLSYAYIDARYPGKHYIDADASMADLYRAYAYDIIDYIKTHINSENQGDTHV